MSARFDQLSNRHKALLARCDAQRAQLGGIAQEIDNELGRVDRGIALVRRALSHPLVVVAGVAVIALAGPRRLMGWVTKGLMFYTTARRMARLARRQPKEEPAGALADQSPR
ncbi:MAG TPA: YqjK family protein [Steroidobacter sp.]